MTGPTSRSTRTPAPPVVLLTVLLGVLVGTGACTSSSDTAHVTAATSPAAGAGHTVRGRTTEPDESHSRRGTRNDAPSPPSEHACYRLPSDQLARASDGHRPVPCRTSHTAQTIFVGTLDTVVHGHRLAFGSHRVRHRLSATCRRRLAGFLGGDSTSRSLSRFAVVWFRPTAGQVAHGARWFRCDAVAFATAHSLVDLPGTSRMRHVLDDPDALDHFGTCGTSAPGSPDFHRVACERRHSWLAVDTVHLSGGDTYPGKATVRSAGDGTCRDEVRKRNGPSLRFKYGWEWPTRTQWRNGQHYGFCWARSGR